MSTVVTDCMIRSCIYNMGYKCDLSSIKISRMGDCLMWRDKAWLDQSGDLVEGRGGELGSPDSNDTHN